MTEKTTMKTLLAATLIGAMKIYLWLILAPFSLLGFMYDDQIEISF